MKFDFWLELPKTILSLTSNNKTLIEEKQKADLFEKLNKKINFKLKEILRKEEDLNLNSEISEKLKSILKERTKITCEAVKLSISLMTKFLNDVQQNDLKLKEEEENKESNLENLKRIKYFLSISRVVYKNSEAEKSRMNSNNKHFEFFNMISSFLEKVQLDIVKITNSILANNNNNNN